MSQHSAPVWFQIVDSQPSTPSSDASPTNGLSTDIPVLDESQGSLPYHLRIPNYLIPTIERKFPSPKLLKGWVATWCKHHVDPEGLSPGEPESYLKLFEERLLQAPLSETTMTGTGLPNTITFPTMYTTLKGPILLELVSITDVGISPFLLEEFRLRRENEMLSHLKGAADSPTLDTSYTSLAAIRSKLTPYPRCVLKFLFTDGFKKVEAFEQEFLPHFALGLTPLGCKVLLCDVAIFGGKMFIERANVKFIGGNGDTDATQDSKLQQIHYDRMEEDSKIISTNYYANVDTLYSSY
ncbi:hypothetical protein FA15DRAFT_701749 [Coprinopsis marcescibilis]|uniref:RecQ mediated genome instability protein 1 OB-fold domain-containing protein n=1 Tax=Coprinopsis marcescibilis TaxID=230819 RepID=A0A5C3L486_COPMA|nr:hypothetical protein FA15DRAFT_701749 [Coprinopsis marcescibilis]